MHFVAEQLSGQAPQWEATSLLAALGALHQGFEQHRQAAAYVLGAVQGQVVSHLENAQLLLAVADPLAPRLAATRAANLLRPGDGEGE